VTAPLLAALSDPALCGYQVNSNSALFVCCLFAQLGGFVCLLRELRDRLRLRLEVGVGRGQKFVVARAGMVLRKLRVGIPRALTWPEAETYEVVMS
jgi:hypothetical protein